MYEIVCKTYFASSVLLLHGKQGLRSVKSTHLPPMWPGFKSQRRRHMWVEFVVLREVFLLVLRFSLLLKNQHFHIPILPGIR